MTYVYLLEHLHVIAEGNECVKTLGIYASESEALQAVERLKIQQGFKDFPSVNPDSGEESGFYICRYELGKDHWPEGFVSV
ncbi:hypothetical protein ACFSJ3_10265 [Corallincola platygyrae]|uniref:DUF7336 domain-containing protein n=1 Tax=Corallincola platygyrae TaxID=1193278 RepID=A0ABW4XLD1_9GAMM